MNKVDEQIQLEMQSVTRGVERFYDSLRRDAEHGHEFDGPVGSAMINEAMGRFIPAVRTMQKHARARMRTMQLQGGRPDGTEEILRALSPAAIAYITIRTYMNNLGVDKPWTRLAHGIGSHLNQQIQFDQLRKLESERVKQHGGYNRISIMKREVKKINPKVARKWVKRLDDLATTWWDSKVHTRVGLKLLEELAATVPETFLLDLVYEKTATGKLLQKRYARLTPEAHQRLDKEYQTYAEGRPWMVPMVCTPKPWTSNTKGGYLRTYKPLVKGRSHRISGDDVVSETTLAAINRIQETAWAINTGVLEVAQRALANGYEEVMPVEPRRPMPERIDDDVYAQMTREERAALKLKRKDIHDHNNRLEALRRVTDRQIMVAADFAHQPAIYFPHQLDFRGRAYPLPQDLHPQADDLGKSLLVLSERKQLGERGLAWLAYTLASTYGMDKCSREEQIEWVNEHADDIVRVGQVPLMEGYHFWHQADEPWQFLAAAQEYVAAWSLDDPTEHWSNLPVFVDGTCNGLQHLSAMGLDPVGAHAVNLTSDPVRQDIYGIVADKVAEAVAADIEIDNTGDYVCRPDNVEAAHAWDGHVTRDTVKRGVMTVPYGLTDIGMRNQLIEDRHTAGLEGDPRENAAYLRDRMKEALDETIEKGREIMDWLQDCAAILTEHGVACEWHTPSGFKVYQGYYKQVPSTYTIMGVGRPKVQVTLQEPDPKQGFIKSKQVLSVAPNVVHSFDAAHMMRSVVAARADTHVAVVHDSYGCHACDMDDFLDTIKREFVDIYQQDWFESLAEDFAACLAGIEGARLVSPPERGDFDITEVLESEYFFS